MFGLRWCRGQRSIYDAARSAALPSCILASAAWPSPTRWSACMPGARRRCHWATWRPRGGSAIRVAIRASSGPTRTEQRTSARRPVSRVLSHGGDRGDGHPSTVDGCPSPLAADPRAERRTPSRASPTGHLEALLFGLAPGRACPFHPARPTEVDLPVRHCGAGPRLSADGSYPLPCVAELGLSSCCPGSPRSDTRPSGRLADAPILPLITGRPPAQLTPRR